MPPLSPVRPTLARSASARGVALLLLAGALFGLMAFVTKLATVRLAGAQVAFMRFAVGAAGVAAAHLGGVRLRPVNHRALLLRGTFGGAAVLLFFSSMAHLPVGTATLLTYTAPIFTTVDAALFLGERVTRATLLALLLTLVGVTLVVTGHAPPGHLGFGPWELCGLLSAVLSGAAVTAVRAARRTDGAWEVFGAFCVFGLLATVPFAAASWRAPTPWEWLLLVGVGALALVAQVLFTVALGEVRAATSGVISQVTPVTALLLGVLFEHEVLPALSLLGGALTLGGVALAAAWGTAAPVEEAAAPVEEAAAPRSPLSA